MLPCNVGVSDTLKKFLTLSQTLYQWPAFAQSRDILLQACFAAN